MSFIALNGCWIIGPGSKKAPKLFPGLVIKVKMNKSNLIKLEVIKMKENK